MIMSVNPMLETPLYLQLKNEIIRGITTGELIEGEELPSVRQLACDLGINLHTVNKVYDILRNEGFITLHRQKGATVSSKENYKITEEFNRHLKCDLTVLITEAKCRGMKLEEFCQICNNIFNSLNSNNKNGRGF